MLRITRLPVEDGVRAQFRPAASVAFLAAADAVSSPRDSPPSAWDVDVFLDTLFFPNLALPISIAAAMAQLDRAVVHYLLDLMEDEWSC